MYIQPMSNSYQLRRQLGRRAVGVMVVVQLLAADDDAPGHDVAARVLAGEIAVAPVVADAVDDAGGGDRDPHHLHRPDRGADRPEQHDVDDQHQAAALPRVARIDVALDPVVGRADGRTCPAFRDSWTRRDRAQRPAAALCGCRASAGCADRRPFRPWRDACDGWRPIPWSPCRWSATARSGRNG